MTDRELLELAARAAGYLETASIQDGYGFIALAVMDEDGDWTGKEWNPLNDDGDALRLAVACGINPIQCIYSVDAMNFDSCIVETELFIDHNGDKNAATLRAITRAAAQMQLNKEQNT